MRGQAFAFTSYRLGLCAYIDGDSGDGDGGWLVASATVFVHHM